MTTHAQRHAQSREQAAKDQRTLLRETARLLGREPNLNEAEQHRLAELGPRVAALDGLTVMRQCATIQRSGLKVF